MDSGNYLVHAVVVMVRSIFGNLVAEPDAELAHGLEAMRASCMAPLAIWPWRSPATVPGCDQDPAHAAFGHASVEHPLHSPTWGSDVKPHKEFRRAAQKSHATVTQGVSVRSPVSAVILLKFLLQLGFGCLFNFYNTTTTTL